MHERYADQGLRIVAVNAWDEPRGMVLDFAEKNELPYPILLFGEDVFRKSYRGTVIPVSYLLDRTGKIIDYHEGWAEGDEKKLSAKIEKALGQAEGK